MTEHSGLTLQVLRDRYSVVRLAPDAAIPQTPLGGALLSLTITPEEISIVCPEASAPAGAETVAGWRALRVMA
ncbi:MAG TPA: hypothetical protein VF808_08510 [Ktedonobacterales bacterium]